MTGRGPYDPNRRCETPEERVDRLISEVQASASASACAELRAAIAAIPLNDRHRRARASAALAKC